MLTRLCIIVVSVCFPHGAFAAFGEQSSLAPCTILGGNTMTRADRLISAQPSDIVLSVSQAFYSGFGEYERSIALLRDSTNWELVVAEVGHSVFLGEHPVQTTVRRRAVSAELASAMSEAWHISFSDLRAPAFRWEDAGIYRFRDGEGNCASVQVPDSRQMSGKLVDLVDRIAPLAEPGAGPHGIAREQVALRRAAEFLREFGLAAEP